MGTSSHSKYVNEVTKNQQPETQKMVGKKGENTILCVKKKMAVVYDTHILLQMKCYPVRA